VVEVLPGVASVLSGLPYYYVRGASPGSVGYFIDGVRVPLLFHVGPGPSVISPGLVERVDLFPGSFPARFGRYSGAIFAGSLLGTSSTTAYVESAAGVQAGGRTGLTAVVVALLFLACLMISPLAGSVPAYATAPALFFVGCLMLRDLVELDWDDTTEVIPAALTALAMPFTYSIATGLAFGFISYAVLKLFTGRAREVHVSVWIIAAVFLFKFAYVGAH
jgi:hypothetical protein